MIRTISLLLLAALALPFARTPICSSAGHEHDGHHMMQSSVVAQDGPLGEASDCHQLMACDTSITGVMATKNGTITSGPRLAVMHDRLPLRHLAPARAPVSPPPQSV